MRPHNACAGDTRTTRNVVLVRPRSQEHAPWAEAERRREPKKFGTGLNEGLAVNHDPCVATGSTIHPPEADHERWIGASAGQHMIEQQATLKAIAVEAADQSAESDHPCDYSPLSLAIAWASRDAPCPPR